MKVLIIQIKQLGDVLLSTPIAENIKTFYPNTQVHFLTSSFAKDIVEENPFIDKVITIENGVLNELKTIWKIKKERYDAVLDVQRTGRSKRITLFSSAKIRAAFKGKDTFFYYNKLINQKTHGYTAFERLDLLKAVGINNPKKVMPKLFFSKKDEKQVVEYLNKNNIKEYFIVSPTARKPTKMWMPEEFGKLADALSKQFKLKAVVVYGTEKERQIAENCAKYIENGHLIEKPFSIKVFAALVKHAKFSLGNDSFASHVAVSQNIKTVVIGGPTSGWFPTNEKTLTVYKGLPCQPCGNADKCPYNLACYKTLRYEEVVNKVIDFLSKD